MPYSNVPDEKQDEMERCVKKVTGEGRSKESAIAICYASIVEGKSLDDAMKSFDLGEIKIGARNSAKDAERLQTIHDYAVENGAKCGTDDEEMKAVDLVAFGSEVKAIGDGKVAGYLVRFGGKDATGEYFDRDTDFGEADKLPVIYHHGFDEVLKRKRIGSGEIKRDEVGLWMEAQLQLRDEYEAAIYEMAKLGKLGWSSGTAQHVTEKDERGKIKQWFLTEASLTPTPAEPRNVVTSIKSFIQSQNTAIQTEENPMAEETIDVKAIAAEAAKAAVAEFMKSAPAEKPPVAVVADEADRALQGNPFKGMGEFMKAIHLASVSPTDEDKRLKPLKAASGMNEFSGVDGGYAVLPQFAAGIWERTVEQSQIISRCSVDTVGANSNSITYTAVDDDTRSAGNRYGGITGYWLPEAGTISATQAKLRQVELKLHKLAAAVYATDELLADGTALESMINRVVPETLTWYVEEAVMRGTGVGQPLGIELSPALLSLTRIDGNEIDTDDLFGMYARHEGRNKVWLANPGTLPQLGKLTISTYPVWLPANGMAGTPQATLLGIPLIFSEHTRALGTQGDLSLLDLSAYQLVTKGGVESASSIHVKFLNAESVFRFVVRYGGGSLWDAPLTPDYGNSRSPFVQLTASS